MNKINLSKNQILYLDLIKRKITKKDKEILIAIQEIESLVINSSNENLIIAIDGKSGSGKTTLSKHLKEIFNANLFHMDDFFQKPTIDLIDSTSNYGSNINFKKIIDSIIKPINNNEDITYKPFDFKSHIHLNEITIKHKRINIIEGSFSMHPYLFKNYQYTIFLKVNYLKQIYRLRKRVGLKRLIKFITTWFPNENKYNKKLKIESKANIII